MLLVNFSSKLQDISIKNWNYYKEDFGKTIKTQQNFKAYIHIYKKVQ